MSGDPKTLTPPWQYYRRKGLSEMRPYVPGEDLSGISVSEADRATMAEDARWGMVTGGYIARNPKNHADQRYVAQAYFNANLEPVGVPVVARDEAAELRAALEALAGSYVTNKVPHDNLWNMLVRTEVLERARAALAASEGQQ